MNHCAMAKCELPTRPTLPLHHSCFARNSIVSYPSSASCVPSTAMTPSESNAPRQSTLTIAYPRGHHSAGSGASNFSRPLRVPSGMPKFQGVMSLREEMPLNFLPKGLQQTSAGVSLAAAFAGLYTSAYSLTPSRTVMATSCSMRMSSLMPSDLAPFQPLGSISVRGLSGDQPEPSPSFGADSGMTGTWTLKGFIVWRMPWG